MGVHLQQITDEQQSARRRNWSLALESARMKSRHCNHSELITTLRDRASGSTYRSVYDQRNLLVPSRKPFLAENRQEFR